MSTNVVAGPTTTEERALTKRDLTKPLATLTNTKTLLEQMGPELQKVLAQHLDSDRFMRIAISCFQRTPKLLECSGLSFVRAVMEAAQIGLELDSSFGYAYLVPFKGQIQLIPGYRGLIDLARRSGQVTDYYAYVVREGDEFQVVMGLERNIVHKPKLTFDGKMTHVYAVAKLTSGEPDFEVMSKAQVDAIRGRSKAANDGPWVTDYEEMARKTVIKRLSKRLPLSAEFRRAVELDDEQYPDGEEERPKRVDLDLTDVLRRRGETPEQSAAASALMEDAVAAAATDGHGADTASQPAGEAQPTTVDVMAARGRLIHLAQDRKLTETATKPPHKGAVLLRADGDEMAAILGVAAGASVILADLKDEQVIALARLLETGELPLEGADQAGAGSAGGA